MEDRLKDDLPWGRKRADEALCASEARYRRLLEQPGMEYRFSMSTRD